MSREVVDAPAVAAAGARLRDCGERVPRPRPEAVGLSTRANLSLGVEVSQFDAVWSDGLSAVRAELGLLAAALQQASSARQALERMSVRLLSHASPTRAEDLP